MNSFCKYIIGKLSLTDDKTINFGALLIRGISDSVLIVGIVLCIFFLFLSIKKIHSKTINYIAKTTFGIYLAHETVFTEQILWRGLFNIAGYQYLSPYFPMLSLASIAIVFAICSVLDSFRLILFEPLALRVANGILLNFNKKYINEKIINRKLE
jgi:hypothetical protein